jgi:hypothetical protein
VYQAVCRIKDIIFQASTTHDAMVKEHQSNQHKKYICMEVRPNTISYAFYINGAKGVGEHLGLQNPT